LVVKCSCAPPENIHRKLRSLAAFSKILNPFGALTFYPPSFGVIVKMSEIKTRFFYKRRPSQVPLSDPVSTKSTVKRVVAEDENAVSKPKRPRRKKTGENLVLNTVFTTRLRS